MIHISFDTAKLACEKGYKVGSDRFYTKERKHGLCFITHNKKVVNGEEDRIYYEAPYQAELQEWLRNEHKIHIVVMQSNLPMTEPQTDEWEWGYNIVMVDNPNECLSVRMGYNTYEDALEAGLYEALNIIK